MSSPPGWAPPKTKLKLDCEVEPVPTLIVIRTSFEVNTEVLDPEGNPTVTPQETTKRFKMKGFHPGSSSEKFAAAIIPKTDGLIPAKGEAAVIQVLNRLKTKLEAAGVTAPAPAGGAASMASPTALVSPVAPTHQQLQQQQQMEEQLQGYYGSGASSSSGGGATAPARPGELNAARAPAAAAPRTAYDEQVEEERKRAAAAAQAAKAQAQAEARAAAAAAAAAATTAQASAAASTRSAAHSAGAGGKKGSDLGPAPPENNFQNYDYSKYATGSAAAAAAAAGSRLKRAPRAAATEKAKIAKLDSYLEDLYEEDVDKKIRATGLILQLVQMPDHLEKLAGNQQLTSALARVLVDDRKKSIALTTNILEVFFCFSSISQLHGVLTANKIGNTALNVIDFELMRYDARVREVRSESDYQRLQGYLFKQEKLLFVCFYILLNMSEDIMIELRIKQRKIIPMLVTVLGNHDNKDTSCLTHLRLLCVAFLKKLSLIEANTIELQQFEMMRVTLRYVAPSPTPSDDTLCSALFRLTQNLVFNRECRVTAANTLVGPAVAALQRPNCATAAARLLYMLTTDPALMPVIQPHLANAAAPAIALVLQAPGSVTNIDATALAINMSCIRELVPLLLHGGALPALFSRLEHTNDVYVAKLIRALSEHRESHDVLEKYAMRIAEMVLRGENPEVRMEALGIFANTPLKKEACAELMTKYQLWDFLMQNLVPTQDNDDIAIQVIMLLGNLAVDSRTSGILTTPKLVNLLDENLAIAAKEGDSEMIQQILFTIFRLLQHRKSREVVCQIPAIHDLIITCIGWPHPLVRTYANSCMDVILEHPVTQLKEELMNRRFEVYNEAYMAIISDGGLADLVDEYEEGERAQLEAEALAADANAGLHGHGGAGGDYGDDDGDGEGFDSFYGDGGGRLGGWGNNSATGGGAGTTNRRGVYGNGYREEEDSGEDDDTLGSGANYGDDVAQVRPLFAMSADEPLGSPLPALEVYKRQIVDLFGKTQNEVVIQLDAILKKLRFQRQRIPKEKIHDEDRFDYARAVALVSAAVRDSFFECLETLVDRQSSDLVRTKVLQIFVEFGAIETAAQGEPPFGQTALASLGNIMRSSPELHTLFIFQCLKEPFTDIVLSMSETYLGFIARELAVWTRMRQHQLELAEGLGACAKKFAKVHQVLLDRVERFWEQSSENVEEWRNHRDNNAFNAISQVITFTCKSPNTARRYLPELPIRLYTKMDEFSRLRGVYIKNRWIFSPFLMMSQLANACPGIADFFAGPVWDRKVVEPELMRFYEPLAPALINHRLMKHLLAQLSQLLWEERESFGEPAVMAYYVQTLFSIVRHSAAAAKEFLTAYGQQRGKIIESQNRNGTLSFFAVQILQRALEFAQTSGPLCNACVQGVVMICVPTRGHEKMWQELREEMENSLSDVVRMLQDICQKLLTTTADQQSDATKEALIGVITIMSTYSSSARGQLFNTEMVKNYSREQIIFRVLSTEATATATNFIDDDVRLAAAKCLVALSISNFQQHGIQHLLDLFSSLPLVVSSTHYEVMCYLTYFMFKMALHEDSGESGRGNTVDNSPGKVFRSLYAPEISATIFTLLERLVLESAAEHASYWELRFMQACVKFLMAGWVKMEFHADNLGLRPIDILSAIVGKEQSRVQQLGVIFEERKQRYYRLIEQRRCVVSEDELIDHSEFDNKTYKLPDIRLKKYAHVKLSRLDYQHAFLEQTSLGARVSNLLPALGELRRVDIVAFRLIHQLANVIENVTFVGSVTTLLEADFAEWNKVDPGKPVAQCDADEQPNFGERSLTVTAQGNSELVDIRPCANTPSENKDMCQLFVAYRNLKLADPSPADLAAGVIMPGVVLSELCKDDRNVFLVARVNRTVVAAVFAGPYLTPQQQIDYTRRKIAEAERQGRAYVEDPHDTSDLRNAALVTGYFHSTELKAELRMVQVELMAVLSHQLYTRGFLRCYFKADKVERQMLGESGAVLAMAADPLLNDEEGKKGAVVAKDAAATAAAAAGGAGDLDAARALFHWDLKTNIWRKNKEHIFFIKNKILESLLQLLLDDQNKNRVDDAKRAGKIPSVRSIVQRFTPLIRIKMEEYGGQLTTEFEATNADGTLQASAFANDADDDAASSTSASGAAGPGGRRRAEGTAARKRFQNLVEREFKNGLVSANFRVDAPVWEKVLAGSREETLVEAMTRVSSSSSTAPQPMVAAALLSQLPPDLNPRTNPDLWPNEWLAREMEAIALDGIGAGAGANAKGGKLSNMTPEARQQQKEIEAEMRRRRANLLEQEANRVRDEREAEARRKEWDLPPLLQSWVVPSSAAVLRMVHAMLTKSQGDVFQQVCTALRTIPAQGLGLLEAVRATLSSFHYQLRASVLDSLPLANYNVCMKILLVIETSLVDVAAGLEPALASLEYFELCLEIVKDMARLLLSLLESRNAAYTAAATQGAATVPKARVSTVAASTDGLDNLADAEAAAAAAAAAAGTADVTLGGAGFESVDNATSVVGKGTLDPAEERLMYGICKTLVALMSQVSRICLFKGSSFLIVEGNRKCRQHAQQQLFTKCQLICDTVQAILLYDLEKENEMDDTSSAATAAVLGVAAGASAAGGDKGNRTRSSHIIRDKTRVYAVNVLSYFIHVDHVFRYSFLNEYSVSSIKAERSLRASMIQQVLEGADMLRFRDKLEPYLRIQRILLQDEFIIQVQFFEHSLGAPYGENYSGSKLVFVTNKAYYVSATAFPEDTAQNIKDFTTPDRLSQFVHLSRYDFSDIVRIYRDISGQVMGIRRFCDPAAVRIRSTTIRKQTDIFLNRTQGVVESFLTELSRRARDDAHRVHTIALDEVTPAALPFLFQECRSELSSSTYPKLMTHVHVIKRDKSVVKRVMSWVSVGEGGGDQFIVITPYDAKSWEPALAGEDDDEIVDAGPWDPSRVPRPPANRGGSGARGVRGGLDDKVIDAKSDQLKAMFSVPAPSALPDFMNALPSLPVGSFGGATPFFFPVTEIQSVDFTEDSEAEMIIRIKRLGGSNDKEKRIPSVYIKFADDTGREMWRRELKKLFYSGSFGRWQENILPDLSDMSRRKQELL